MPYLMNLEYRKLVMMHFQIVLKSVRRCDNVILFSANEILFSKMFRK